MIKTPKQQNLIIQRLAAELATHKVKELRQEITNMAVATVSTAMCITLSDKFNFTTEQINSLLFKMADQMDSVLKNYLTMEDIEKWCVDNGIINMLDLKNKKEIPPCKAFGHEETSDPGCQNCYENYNQRFQACLIYKKEVTV